MATTSTLPTVMSPMVPTPSFSMSKPTLAVAFSPRALMLTSPILTLPTAVSPDM